VRRRTACWLLLALVLVSCAGTPAPRATTEAPQAVREGPPGSAHALLATLRVKGRAPWTGYTRERFGPAWADVDRNGCGTRDDVLRRDLADLRLRPGTRGCVVLSGTLHDPYTGRVVLFEKWHADDVQVDHVVALSDAWRKGAQSWTPARRLAFANDPLELLAVSGAVNQAKGGSDAASWLPAYRAGRCAFVARQVAVKARYGLWVTAAERDAIARVLAGCPRQPVPH